MVVRVGDVKAETKSIKSKNPVWTEDIELPVEDSNEYIEIMLLHNGLVGRTTLGRVRLTIIEVAAQGERGIINAPFEVLNEDLEFDGVSRGTLYLEMKWIYDEATAEMLAANKAAAMKGGLFSGLWPWKKKKKKEDEDVATAIADAEAKQNERNKVLVDDEDNDDMMNNVAMRMTPYELAVYMEEQRQKRSTDIEKYMENLDNETLDIQEGV